MSSLFRLGQLLQGKLSVYTIGKQIHESVWLATYEMIASMTPQKHAANPSGLESNQSEQTVVIKSVRHFRLQNERDVLRRFQSSTPFLRPLMDEIIEDDASGPPAIVLRHLDDDLYNASAAERLTGAEIRYVAKGMLEALSVLHEHGFVHTGGVDRVTDIKLDNVLVNYGKEELRFTHVGLADCGSTVHEDSGYAKDGDLIGAPIFRSPEAMLQMRWGTATDIWSFGTVLISLIWGKNWHIFKPDVPIDHEDYLLKILMKQHQFFGPFPVTYQEIADEDTLNILKIVMYGVPPELRKPFQRIGEREISKQDKAFVLKIMKLDPRDRPTAAELLRDEWFQP